ncbi:MAG: radical SAM protein, partial [Gammaproteobacteria bacterium]|nr:radical SAM protein [Gammaproteobacteria bacterium]
MRLPVRGRGASHDLPNRFERLHLEPEAEFDGEGEQPRKTHFFIDRSRSVISHNSSPDLGFSVSLN